MGKAKKFKPSEEVEVQRGVGTPWELARYAAPLWGPGAEPTAGGPMKGWHRIQLDPSSPPRYIDTRNGMEWSEPTEHTREVRHVLVPSSRLRAPKELQRVPFGPEFAETTATWIAAGMQVGPMVTDVKLYRDEHATKAVDGMVWRTSAGRLVRQRGGIVADRGALKVHAEIVAGRGGMVLVRLDRLTDPSEEHMPRDIDGHQTCIRCGVIMRADGKNKPCRGRTPPITTRGEST